MTNALSLIPKRLANWQVMSRIALFYCAARIIWTLRQWSRHTILLPSAVPGCREEDARIVTSKKYFHTSKGFHLYMRKWLPKNKQKPRAIVFIVHGVGEHAGRYDHVARMMAKEGFAVFSLDHQGHGLSDGPRVYAEDMNHLAQDYLEYAQHILKMSSSEKNPPFETTHNLATLPRFLFGHSMGGVLASMIHDLDDQMKWNGVILSAGAFFCHPMAKYAWFRGATAFLVNFFPRFPTDTFSWTSLSRDPHWITRIQRDPAGAPHGVTLKLGYQIVINGLEVLKRAPTWKTPVYVYHGEKDQCTFSKGSEKFHRVCGSEDKTLKIIPTDIHELHNDQGYEQIVQDVIEWIEKRLPIITTTSNTKKHKEEKVLPNIR